MNPSLPLVAIVLAPLSAPARPGDPLRDLAAARLSVPSDRLEEIARVGRSFPLLDARVVEASFRDLASALLVTVAADEEGNPVDPDALDLLEAAAARERFGKKDRLLAESLAASAPGEVLPLGVWLDTMALGFDPRLDLVSRLGGASTSTEVDAALAASAEGLRAAMRNGVTGPFAEAAAAAGFEVRFVGEYVPVVYVSGPASLVPSLEERPEVVSIHLEGKAELELDTSGATVRADGVWTAPNGVTGVGAIATDIEGGGITNLNPYLPTPILYQTPPGSFASHATAIGGMIASDHPVYRGMAPGAMLYSANLPTSESNTISGANWSIANGSHIMNVSLNLGANTPPTLNLSDRAFDYIVRSTGRLLVKSCGNQGLASGVVTSPGRGWNMLSVGNFTDNGTKVWTDDSMNTSSSWVDPTTGMQKPEVAAPGTNITGTTLSTPWIGLNGSGTSYAAPHAVGAACLLYERDPLLKAWPEAIKAILMASAWHNVEGAALFSDKDGAGGIHALAADRVVQRGTNGYVRGVLTASSFNASGQFDLPFAIEKNNRTRVVLSWDSVAGAPPSYSTDALAAKFDLTMLDPSGTAVASTTHPSSSFRILDFVPAASGVFTVRLQQTLFTGASEPYAVAVSQFFDTHSNRIAGVVPHPIGATTTITGSDPYHPGAACFVVLGLSGVANGEGYGVGDHTVPIVPDAGLYLPLLYPAAFVGFTGTLNSGGSMTFSTVVPNLPGLIGVSLSYSFLTLLPAGPLGVGEISPGAAAPIVP